MTGRQFERTRRLLGDDNTDFLHERTVAIAGIGAVGGYALEALARIGIGHFILVDFDKVSESNINRQILALHSTIGMLKTDAAEKRVKDINPGCIVEKHPVVISEENLPIFSSADIILDCIDSVGAKIGLLAYAYEQGRALARGYHLALVQGAYHRYAVGAFNMHEGFSDRLFRDVFMRVETVNFLFPVVGRGRGSESYSCDIFLVMRLQCFGEFGSFPYADQQYSRRERVQCPCMPDFQVLFPEMSHCGELDFSDDICGSPCIRLVYGNDDSRRIIVYVFSQHCAVGQDQRRNANIFFHKCRFIIRIYRVCQDEVSRPIVRAYACLTGILSIRL